MEFFEIFISFISILILIVQIAILENVQMTRKEQLDRIKREGWFTKGNTRKISMSSRAEPSKNRKFSYSNHTQGKN